MPVHCCPGFPEQEGVLAAPLHTLYPYFLNRRGAKRGALDSSWALPSLHAVLEPR